MRTISKFSAPEGSPNPTKYAKDGWTDFSKHVRSAEIVKVYRLGKNIWVGLNTEPETAWHIHLGSTGWFLPHNQLARDLCTVDGVHSNFLHPVNPATVRVRVHFDDGQIWDYHDSRTWGNWKIREGATPRDEKYFQELGPDWLDESAMASMALMSCNQKRHATLVLQDQHVAAGVGHYLANESLWMARVHPHKKWHLLSEERKILVCQCVVRTIRMAALSNNHNHWAVFQRKGLPCPDCGTKIKRAVQGNRGDYYCYKCQSKHR